MGMFLRAFGFLLLLAIVPPPAVADRPCGVLLAYKSGGGLKKYEAAIACNNRGVDLYSAGKYQAAIRQYDSALRLNPSYTEAYSNRGVAYDALNDHQKAVGDYSQAIRLNPRLVAAYSNRAAAYKDLGQMELALADLDSIIKLTPRSAQAYNKRGQSYQSLGRLEFALKDFEKALSLNRHLSEAKANRDSLRRSLNQAQTGLAQTAAVQPGPSQTKRAGQTASGQILASQRPASRPSPAQTETTKIASSLPVLPDASSLKPSSREAGVAPARGAATVPGNLPPGRSQRTAPSGQSGPISLESVPPPPGTRCGGPSGAQGINLIQEPGRYAANLTYHILGNLCYAFGQYQAAAKNYEAAVAANPIDKFAYFRRGNAYQAAGHYSRAIADYDRVLALSPRFKPAITKRLRAQSALNKLYEGNVQDTSRSPDNPAATPAGSSIAP